MPVKRETAEQLAEERDNDQKAVPIPSAGDTPFADINIVPYLQQLQGDIASSQTPYIYPKVLSYIDGKNGRLWRGIYGDIANSELASTVSSFWVAKKHGKKAWLGFAMIPPTNWVGVANRESHFVRKWHAVAFGVIAREGGGKALLTYDCDVKEFLDGGPQRVRDVLRNGALKKLYDTIRRNGSVKVWVNQHKQEEFDEGHLIKPSFEKLTEWASYGDQFFTGSQDPRTSNKYYCITAP
jgi:hypothetical protein